jgi:hypothetical protein
MMVVPPIATELKGAVPCPLAKLLVQVAMESKCSAYVRPGSVPIGTGVWARVDRQRIVTARSDSRCFIGSGNLKVKYKGYYVLVRVRGR